MSEANRKDVHFSLKAASPQKTEVSFAEMSEANKDVKFSLKVIMHKQKARVLFAEIDSNFADVMFSFITLPLGRIVRILKQHYGDEAPSFGSLSSLYNGLSNLDSFQYFQKDGAKSSLLDPRSSSDAQCRRLKLDISDCPPPEYLVCSDKKCRRRLQSASVYYDNVGCCCLYSMKRAVKKVTHGQSGEGKNDGVFTVSSASFLIADDLKIVHNNMTCFHLLSASSATANAKTETMHITFGFAEVMDLLKASLISSTPLSDVILNKTGEMMKYEESKTLSCQIENASTDSNSKKMNLKLMVQKSTNKLLYAEAEEDFVEFLFSFLVIPLGGVVRLLANDSSLVSIDNLYRNIDHLNEEEYFKNPAAKNSLIKPKIPHGYVSESHILPLEEECLPASYHEYRWHSSFKFPRGKGTYLKGTATYRVMDDLTVTPFCLTISSFNEMQIPLADLHVKELEIGLEEALGILRASLTSTTALTDALNLTILTNHISNKRPRQEH